MQPGKRFHFDRLYGTSPQPYDGISLYQVGDLGCHSDFELAPHAQLCYEMVYVSSGRGWFSVNGHRVGVSAGDMMALGPGDIHAGGADDRDPYRCFYLGFLFDDRPPDGLPDSPFAAIRRMLDAKSAPVARDRFDIGHCFSTLLREVRRPGPYAHPMIQSCLHQIIIQAYRNFFTDWAYVDDCREAWSGAETVVYRAVSYIDRHLLDIRDLTGISDALGYSYSYLSHLFSRETGVSLRDFHARKKWRKAAELMRSQHHSVTEIAAIMGYESIHTFSRAFKKAVGMPPTAYRQLHRSK